MGTLLIYRYSLWSISWRTRRSRDFAALYIGWSTQNHCTGRTQCTAQWSKIIKICPKSQFLSKTSKISFLYFFEYLSIIQVCVGIILQPYLLVGQHKTTARVAPSALHSGPKSSKFVQKVNFYQNFYQNLSKK